jgi:glycerol uptake facilitator-like aquaporin
VIARPRRLLAEFLGTLLLTTVVIGSGISAARLSPGDIGLELTENALATAFGLFVLIAVLTPISGAQLNPVISLVDAALGRRTWSDALLYTSVQVAGCFTGAVLANVMFGLGALSISNKARLTPPHFLGEIVATAGLVVVVFLLARTGRDRLAPAAVAAYIGAAYLFTSSASFANPAITIARMFSNTFAGIAPASVGGFIAAQVIGAGIGLMTVRVLAPVPAASGADIVAPAGKPHG